jgi:hypothetical protein
MPVQAEILASKRTVNDLLRDVIINSLGILTGLVFRDFIMSITTFLNPLVKIEEIVFTFFIFMVVLLVTIVLCIAWN